MPVFIIRESAEKYRIFFEDPIEFVPSTDKRHDIASLTQKWMEIVEGYIRRYPHEYLWMHSHWKMRKKRRRDVKKG